MYAINNIKINILDINKDNEYKCIEKYIIDYLSTKDIYNIKIFSKSIDARNKNNIYYVYTVTFDSNKNLDINNYKNLLLKDKYIYNTKKIIKEQKYRPVVIGTGPAGLFAGLILAEAGANPIIIERGKAVDDRLIDVTNFFEKGILDEESNVQFGEGGAGTFSDGKLTTGINNERIKKVIDELVEGGADPKIKYIHKPHIGTDVLIKVVKKIREKVISLGGEYRFSTKVINYEEKNNKLISLICKNMNTNEEYKINTDIAVLAIGHSARDTFYMLRDNKMHLEKKPFSVGVRIEHKQSMINEVQYGKYMNILPPAEYKINARTSYGRGVYTFCMCPGGVVVPASSEQGYLVVNGMSYSKRDKENANSAVLVDIYPKDLEEDILSGVEFQRKLEKKAFELGGSNYHAPIQKVIDYINNKKTIKLGNVLPSYSIGYTLSNINDIFPEYINLSLREGLVKLNNKIRGFSEKDAIITAIESRSSSPIRMIRDENLNSSVIGLIPSGEGAGYAGGIMSAAVDGIRVAEEIIKRRSL